MQASPYNVLLSACGIRGVQPLWRMILPRPYCDAAGYGGSRPRLLPLADSFALLVSPMGLC